jgi:D-alanyl-lipoteichoic acid acyltransferase DltB (MBOAT superfamily)
VASYIFYGWWDWRFLSLILFSSLVDYFVGIALLKKKNSFTRKLLLSVSIIINIGFLGFFKYFNFFIDSFVDLFSLFGLHINERTLNIILPVGISFYTFQTLSYSIDCYRKKLEPTKDFVAFFTYVSFFPQLVAGPIERATNLLPQFFKPRIFNYAFAMSGVRLILWGFFKKLVIADNCALVVDQIFADYETLSSFSLLLGTVLFAFQIYGDFSGYSDIAVGVARLFGIHLMRNFALPYFSRDIAEFWRRWHISLNTWFRDYLYIPLGGSMGGKRKIVRNIFVIFLVSGFWHGANWTFIIWGFLNALYFLPLILQGKNRKYLDIVAADSNFPSLAELSRILLTFGLVCLAWIFFRSKNVPEAFEYIFLLFSFKGGLDFLPYLAPVPFIVLLLSFEWYGRRLECPLYFDFNRRYIKYSFYILFIVFILYFGAEANNSFIYFQF